MAQNKSKNKEKTIVFRLQNESAQHGLTYTIQGWGKSQMYDDLQINAIESSNKHSLSEPTSIPSPFARIALAKTAFGEVAEHGDDASDVYQKIVSDCLDVAEIFFTFSKWEKQLAIIKWDVDKDLEDLRAHNFIYYKTLKTFLETDAKAYNFDKIKCVYMLKHLATGDIIGATSPATLFFSSANPFKGNDILLSNNHKAFSTAFPLYKRSWDFQEYIYATIAQEVKLPGVAKYTKYAIFYPEFDKYIEKQIPLTGRQAEIDRIKVTPAECLKKYIPFPSDMNVEIMDVPLLRQRADEEGTLIVDVSDFEIVVWDKELRESVYKKYLKKAEKLPLVLPLEGGNNTKYNTWTLTKITKWDNFSVMTSYKEEWYSEKRQLPDGTFFPFLTISDFLTDTIVQLPYKLNPNKNEKTAFFDGNLDADSDYSYLLPLKDTFFYFYTIEDLQTRKLGGKPMLEITEITGGVEVMLRIPVRKNNGNEYVVYRRVYFEAIQPNIDENDGAIVKSDFDFALFPNIKFEKEENAYYRFGLITTQGTNEQLDAVFYDKNQDFKIEPVLRNNKHNKTYGLNRRKFDHIEVTDSGKNNASGMIVPVFSAQEDSNNTTQFTFAVDLGTTNTHIEYSASTIEKKPFNVGSNDIQVCVSDRNDDSLEQEIEKYFIPEIIGEDKRKNVSRFYKFPTRTALSVIDNPDFNKSVYPFVQANIALPYQKLSFGNANVKTQLKWNTDMRQLQYFIDSLCFMMRNKVLLNNGKLDETKIVWFYPLSMQGQKMKKMEEIWQLAYAKYFLGIDANSYERIKDEKRLVNLIPLTESEAPYLFYKNDKTKDNKVLNNLSNLVSVDIGGGTTDVVFVNEKGNIDYMTSFRFAANDIFGLGDKTLCMVDKYMPKIENIITEYDKNTNYLLSTLYDEIKNEKNKNKKGESIATGDVVSFFFSLLDNEIIKQLEIEAKEIDLHYLLKDDDKQKIVFVLFYAAIIYHIAQIMKAKELSMPRHITFSGNGSRLVTIAGDTKLLESLAKLIFEKADFEINENTKLEIIHNAKNPKEVSAKGGINAANKSYQPLDVKFTTLVMLGTKNCEFAGEKTYKNIKAELDNYVENTIENSKQFINDIFDLLENTKYTGGRTEETFVEALGINPRVMRIAKEVLETSDKDFNTWTATNGIEKRMAELDDKAQKIEETFFFYPLIGFLQVLSNEVEKSEN